MNRAARSQCYGCDLSPNALVQKYFSKTGLPNAGPEKNGANGPQMWVLRFLRHLPNPKRAVNTGPFEAFESGLAVRTGHSGFQVEPFCKRERSGSLQAKS